MNRPMAWGLFCLFALVAAGSGIVLLKGGHSSEIAAPVPQELLARAEHIVGPPPAPPPTPTGGRLEIRRLIVPHLIPLQGRAPLSVLQQRQVPHLAGASPQDQAAWQAKQDAQQAAYQQAIQAELQQLADQLKASQQQAPGQNQIVAVLTAITGLIGAVAALLSALKGSQAKLA